MSQIPDQAQAILDFWFADSRDSMEAFLERRQTWFFNSAEFDREIAARFESVIPRAMQGEFASWENNPQSLLALIILLDQFPRNIYRGTPGAFAQDSEALRLAIKMVDAKFDLGLDTIARTFAFLPFEHSEDIEIQQLSVKKARDIVAAEDDPVMRERAQEAVHYAVLHYDIIEQFGRFPHRNEILGRESTAEEIKYLAAGAETFGQQAG